jgi:hypothetical protein
MDSEDVTALVHEIAEALGPEVAQLRSAAPVPGVVTLEILPTNPASAPVGIRVAAVGPTDAVVSLGNTAFEVPAEGAGFSRGSGLVDLRVLIEAAVAGRFRERVWYRGDEEIRRDGLYITGDREIRLISHVSPRWFLSRKRQAHEVSYSPYQGER